MPWGRRLKVSCPTAWPAAPVEDQRKVGGRSASLVAVCGLLLGLLGLDLRVEDGLAAAVHRSQPGSFGDLRRSGRFDQPVRVGLLVPPLPGGESTTGDGACKGKGLREPTGTRPPLLLADQLLNILRR